MPRRHRFPSRIFGAAVEVCDLDHFAKHHLKNSEAPDPCKKDYADVAWTVSQRGSTERRARKANSMKPRFRQAARTLIQCSYNLFRNANSWSSGRYRFGRALIGTVLDRALSFNARSASK